MYESTIYAPVLSCILFSCCEHITLDVKYVEKHITAPKGNLLLNTEQNGLKFQKCVFTEQPVIFLCYDFAHA